LENRGVEVKRDTSEGGGVDYKETSVRLESGLSLDFGCASYPTLKHHLSIDSFVIGASGRWGCCEVQYEREEWKRGDNLSATPYGEYVVVVVVDNSLD